MTGVDPFVKHNNVSVRQLVWTAGVAIAVVTPEVGYGHPGNTPWLSSTTYIPAGGWSS